MPFLNAGRNRGIVTLTEYSPAKRFGIEKRPRLSVKAIRSGIDGFAATTTTNAPTMGTPPESRTLPVIAASVPAAVPLNDDDNRIAATPIATIPETLHRSRRMGTSL